MRNFRQSVELVRNGAFRAMTRRVTYEVKKPMLAMKDNIVPFMAAMDVHTAMLLSARRNLDRPL